MLQDRAYGASKGQEPYVRACMHVCVFTPTSAMDCHMVSYVQVLDSAFRHMVLEASRCHVIEAIHVLLWGLQTGFVPIFFVVHCPFVKEGKKNTSRGSKISNTVSWGS